MSLGLSLWVSAVKGKLGKDAVSEVCSAHERSRTPIQRSHGGPR
jgi:hypothetical protein